ncbi:hypothetical protein C6N75_08640, partial [Streptomyces solincola]
MAAGLSVLRGRGALPRWVRAGVERAPRPLALVPDWTGSFMPDCARLLSHALGFSLYPGASVG